MEKDTLHIEVVKSQHIFFNDNLYDSKKELFFATYFSIFTILALGIDSVYFEKMFFDGRQISNFLAVLYFSLFFTYSNSHLKKLMFAMVFLSYIGELIFCKLLGMYDYRTALIPLYVPFGHAIVYASGFVFSQTPWALKNEIKLKKYFGLFFLVLFLFSGIFLKGTFTLIFGMLFFLLLFGKKWQIVYYFVAICVIYIELVGTYFQCWRWDKLVFGIIPTNNPPMGAVFFYAGGDVILAKIVSIWGNKQLESTTNL